MALPHYAGKQINNYEPVFLSKKEQIKKLLENDYELLSEIIIELRTEKLNKINEKIHQNKR
jgi:hypothetical protein